MCIRTTRIQVCHRMISSGLSKQLLIIFQGRFLQGMSDIRSRIIIGLLSMGEVLITRRRIAIVYVLSNTRLALIE